MHNYPYYPYRWVVLKITYKTEVIYKVLAGFAGGYLYGNSWQINSGIESVEMCDNHICFNGYSGSKYFCIPEGYGMNMDTHAIYSLMTSKQVDDYSVELMPESTDWLKLVDNDDQMDDNVV
jgi:hypothetical protein